LFDDQGIDQGQARGRSGAPTVRLPLLTYDAQGGRMTTAVESAVEIRPFHVETEVRAGFRSPR
jgi:hypothetical protein